MLPKITSSPELLTGKSEADSQMCVGAKTIILPTFWTLADCSTYGLSKNPMSEKLFLESTVTSRAFENTCAVVFGTYSPKSDLLVQPLSLTLKPVEAVFDSVDIFERYHLPTTPILY